MIPRFAILYTFSIAFVRFGGSSKSYVRAYTTWKSPEPIYESVNPGSGVETDFDLVL